MFRKSILVKIFIPFSDKSTSWALKPQIEPCLKESNRDKSEQRHTWFRWIVLFSLFFNIFYFHNDNHIQTLAWFLWVEYDKVFCYSRLWLGNHRIYCGPQALHIMWGREDLCNNHWPYPFKLSLLGIDSTCLKLGPSWCSIFQVCIFSNIYYLFVLSKHCYDWHGD